MDEHTHTLSGGVRALDAADTATPNPDQLAVISVAEVMLGTAVAAHQPRRARILDAVRTRWGRKSPRDRRRHIARRRPDCFEAAAMAREMYRL